MKTSEWVVLCRKKLGWTQDKAAEELKVSKATISSWETGKYVPKIQAIMQLAAFADEKLPSALSYQSASFYATESTKIFVKDNDFKETEETVVVDVQYKDCFAWKVADKSLETVFNQGDTLVIDPKSVPTPTDYVLVKYKGSTQLGVEDQWIFTIRKMKIVDTAKCHFQFVPENGMYPSIDNQQTEVEILGVAKESRRRL